jgi:dihydrofolate synthase/folylpolyglutamate synthase
VRWPGRLEVLRQQPLLVVDGAHNAESARRLRETLLQDFSFSKAILIVGASQDKEIGEIAAELQPLGAVVIATSANHPRAAAASMVAEAFSTRGISAGVAETVPQAVEEALAQAGRDDLVCVLGSLFVAAEARAYLLGIEGDMPSG